MTLIAAPPPGLTTLEQYSAWAGLALAATNSAVLATEGELFDDNGTKIKDVTERVCQANVFFIPVTGELRLICRQNFLLSPDYYAGGQKNWNYVQEFIGSLPLSELFLS